MFFKRYKIKKIILVKNILLLFALLSNNLLGMEKHSNPTQLEVQAAEGLCQLQQKVALDNQTPLHVLCYESTHYETIRQFFDIMNPNDEETIKKHLDMQDNDGNSPLHYACQKKNPSKEIIEALIKNFKPDLNVQNNQGNTLLHCILTNLYNNYSDQMGKTTEDIVEVLVRAGAKREIKNNAGFFPHTIAISINQKRSQNASSLISIEKGNSTKIKNHDEPTAIQDKASIHYLVNENDILPSNDGAALELSVQAPHLINQEVQSLSINNNLHYNNNNNNNNNNNFYPTVNAHQQLISPSASDVLKFNQQLLACCSSENVSVQKICDLINLGADVNYKDHTNNGPLHYACMNKKVTFDIIKLLIEKGALIKTKNIHKQTPAICYMSYPKNITKDIMEFFINNNGLNTYDEPLNYLSLVSSTHFFPITKLLLQKGALLKNTSILHHACQSGDTQKISFLIENGANVNARNKFEQTPLHIACKEGHYEAVKLLIEKGANLNAKDSSNQNTPLHLAANTKIGKILISNGANYTITNRKGKTPLDLRAATRRTHNEKVTKLKKFIEKLNKNKNK